MTPRRVQETESRLTASDVVRAVVIGHQEAARSDEFAAFAAADTARTVLRRAGRRHRRRVGDHLRGQGLVVATVQRRTDRAAGETVRAMRADAVDVVERPLLVARFDGVEVSGRPDFLVRSLDDRSQWEVVHVRLAHEIDADAALRLGLYSRLLGARQGTVPEQAHLVLGSRAVRVVRTAEVEALVERALARTISRAQRGIPMARPSASFEQRAEWRAAFRRAGITSGGLLANLDPSTPIEGVEPEQVQAIVADARAWLDRRHDRYLEFERTLAAVSHDRPAVRPRDAARVGDRFLHVATTPFAFDDRLVVFTVGTRMPHGFDTWHRSGIGRDEIHTALAQTLGEVAAGGTAVCFAYGPATARTLLELASGDARLEAMAAGLIAAPTWVDLQRVLRTTLPGGSTNPSLSLFDRELTGFGSDDPLTGFEAIALAESALEARDRGDRDALARAVADVATNGERMVRRLARVQALLGQHGLGRPRRPVHAADDTASVKNTTTTSREINAARRLAAHGGRAATTRADREAVVLLAGLLGAERAEDRLARLDADERAALSPAEMVDDNVALGGLKFERTLAEEVGRSRVHRFRYPAQEFRLRVGERPLDPLTGQTVGRVHAVDEAAGTIDIARSRRASVPEIEGLLPERPPPVQELRERLLRIAEDVVVHGLDETTHTAAVALLRRAAPAGLVARMGHRSGADGLAHVARGQSGEVLVVQGAGGTGKTRALAATARALAADGHRVAITAVSHRQIVSILDEVAVQAQRAGQPVGVIQLARDGDNASVDPRVTVCDQHGSFRAHLDQLDDNGRFAYPIAGGTQWAFARAEYDQLFHTIMIDEAGQVPLWRGVELAGAARNVIMVGDHLQLPHVSRAAHPAGVSASMLAHMLSDAETISPDRGIFLDTSYRMHPAVVGPISELFYEGRLRADESTSVRHLGGRDRFARPGLHLVTIDQRGARTRSDTEARAVARLVDSLLGRPLHDGAVDRTVTEADIVVSAPWNAHAAALRAVLPEGVRVASVDKHQGVEAPIAILSLATSDPVQLRRTLGFAASPNRLASALQRAQIASIVVASKNLLDASPVTFDEARGLAVLHRLRGRATRHAIRSVADDGDALEAARAAAVVRDRRHELGLTQAELAESAHIGVRTVGRLEDDALSPRPSDRVVASVAKALRWDESSVRALVDGRAPSEAEIRAVAHTALAAVDLAFPGSR